MVWSAADRVIFATVRKSFFAPKLLRTFSVSLSLAYDNHGATNGQHRVRDTPLRPTEEQLQQEFTRWWPSRLVATAAEERLSFRRNLHPSFAAARDC
jgi:hypothetical protein